MQHQKAKAPQAGQWHATDLEEGIKPICIVSSLCFFYTCVVLYRVVCVSWKVHRDAEQAAATDVFMFFMFVFCYMCVCVLWWVCRDEEQQGSSRSDVCALGFYVCLCLCVFVRVFCVLRFFVINVKRWGATGIKLLRWIGSRKWGLGRQPAHYSRTLNSKSQVHHFQPPCKIAHILHVLRFLWPNLF